MGWIKRHREETVALGMLLLMGVALLSLILQKGLTNDEFYRIPAGYYHLQDEFNINCEHPPLAKMVGALPLIVLQPQMPEVDPAVEKDPYSRGHESFAQFWTLNDSGFEAVSFWPRTVMILLALMLGYLIFLYTRRSFGPRAALFALGLYVLEPTMLAHGYIVHNDMPAALAYLFFFFSLDTFVRRPAWRTAVQLGIAIGLALVTKFSMIVIVPIGLLALLIALWRNGSYEVWYKAGLARMGMVVAAALAVINAVYYFNRAPLSEADAGWLQANMGPSAAAFTKLFPLASAVVPSNFLFGIGVMLAHSENGKVASLLGSFSDKGWWYYFPVAFALKTTLPFLLVSIAALVWGLIALAGRRDYRFLLPLVAIGAYMAVCMMSRLNIGIRHFIPVFPFLFILGGALLEKVATLPRRKAAFSAIVLCFCWMAAETIRAYPNYIPYMSQLTGNRPGWEFLSDSNVEWGEDSKALAEYLNARGETHVRAALLGSWLTLKHYGIEMVDPYHTDSAVKTKYLAIGASYLNGSSVANDLKGAGNRPLSDEERRNFFEPYRNQTPEAVFGKTIYLYRVN